MNDLQELKGKLIEEINHLPEDKLQEVLNFVDLLLSQEPARGAEAEMGLEPAQDPLLKFIGGVAHGSLAKDLDQELYGESP